MSTNRILRALLTTALLTTAGVASADLIETGSFNAAGYSVIHFSTPGQITDIRSISGYADPTLSLFDSHGMHLVTNDDEYDATGNFVSLLAHIAGPLSAGSYSLLVSYCCSSGYYASITGANLIGDSGYGGTGTLAGMMDFLDQTPPGGAGNAPYEVLIRTQVPEPASAALVALGLAGLGLRRRKV